MKKLNTTIKNNKNSLYFNIVYIFVFISAERIKSPKQFFVEKNKNEIMFSSQCIYYSLIIQYYNIHSYIY